MSCANGSRPRVSGYIYDRVTVLQPEPGQVAYYPIIDAIEEFRVEANSYSAVGSTGPSPAREPALCGERTLPEAYVLW